MSGSKQRCMNATAITILSMALALSNTMHAHAQAGSTASSASAPTQRLVEQKLQLVGRLLDDSPTASRIALAGNQAAKDALAQARASFDTAKPLVARSELVRADKELNDAMWMIGKARQLVPDSMLRVIEQRAKAAALREAVDSLITSYENHLARTQGLSRGSRASDAILERVRSLLDEARVFENLERIADANKLMYEAEKMLMAGLARVLNTSTVTYAARFETQAAEYAYELERNHSYVDLLPLAIAELKPPPESLARIGQYREQNQTAIRKAQKLAGKKQFHDAIAALRGGTAYLQGALAETGLILPADAVSQ